MKEIKIGIVTYHRSLNYGAELQAFALMKHIQTLGYQASIVDYWPKYRTDTLGEWKSMPISNKIRKIERMVFSFMRLFIKKKHSRDFIQKYMSLSSVKDSFDVVVYGSDQIWRNFNWINFKGFDAVYWGNSFIDAKRKISYAASMGQIIVKNESEIRFIAEHLKNFSALSAREQDFIDYCKATFNIEIKKVLDPIFLLSEQKWREMLPDKNLPNYKYIFYYRLENNDLADKIVNELRRRKGLRVIEMRFRIPEFHYGSRFRFTADAQEFVSFLRNAEHVVSSSFHGVAFSVRFKKDFYYCGTQSSSNRIYSLLDSVGLTSRIVRSFDDFDAITPINWNLVNTKLTRMENDSKKWLKEQLMMGN